MALTATDAVRAERVHARQPQIQALRAIAVGAAVLYHYMPNQVRGGYVGVDVFFVVSGYLMTKTLFNIRSYEGGNGAKANLRSFYLRRISRILPAALVTLLCCAVLILVATSQLSWYRNLQEILASALFVENWAAAINATDYLRGGVGSIAQHFWSLSVEEQFYAVWPIIVFGLLWFSARPTAKRSSRSILLGALVTMTALSLAFSVYETATDPGMAYFNTAARFWELSAGGVFFLLDRDFTIDRRVRAAGGWIGLVLVTFAVFSFNADTRFPGWIAAIPVVGAGFVILNSSAASNWGPQRLLALRPFQFIGDISYSMYLIHWPLLVLALLAVTRGVGVGPAMRIGLLILTVVLSWLMKTFIEDRFRISHVGQAAAPTESGRSVLPSARRAVRAVMVGLVLVLAISGVGYAYISGKVRHYQSDLAAFRAANHASCDAAISAGSDRGCPPAPENPMNSVPSPVIAADGWDHPDCLQSASRTAVITCDLGADAGPILAVVGDSHMAQWVPAIEPWARQHNFRVVTYLKGLCAYTDAPTSRSCADWNAEVSERLLAHPPALVFTSALSAPAGTDVSKSAAALSRKWAQLTSRGTRVVAFRDSPQPELTSVGSVPQCLARTASYPDCTFGLSAGLAADLVGPAAAQTPGTSVVDLSDLLCPKGRCKPVLGPMLVYIDGQHLSALVARALSPALGERLGTLGIG